MEIRTPAPSGGNAGLPGERGLIWRLGSTNDPVSFWIINLYRKRQISGICEDTSQQNGGRRAGRWVAARRPSVRRWVRGVGGSVGVPVRPQCSGGG